MPPEPIIVRSDGSTVTGMSSRAADCTLRISPRELTFIRINHQARLQLEDIEVVIEGRFVVETSGTAHQLDAAERAGLGPLLALYPCRLASAAVNNNATLRLGFDNGAVLVVPPDSDYEAWQIIGPGTTMVICVPGNSGELAIWR